MVGVAMIGAPEYAVELHLKEFELASLINVMSDMCDELSDQPAKRELLLDVLEQLDNELGLLL